MSYDAIVILSSPNLLKPVRHYAGWGKINLIFLERNKPMVCIGKLLSICYSVGTFLMFFLSTFKYQIG